MEYRVALRKQRATIHWYPKLLAVNVKVGLTCKYMGSFEGTPARDQALSGSSLGRLKSRRKEQGSEASQARAKACTEGVSETP